MAWPAWLAAVRLTERPGLRILLAGVGLAAWDLFLDPQMVAEGYWTWQAATPALPGVPGIPVSNYLGWLGFAVVLMAAAVRARSHGRAPYPATTGRCWRSGCGRTSPRCSPTPSSSACRRRRSACPGRPCGAAPIMGAVVLPLALRLRRSPPMTWLLTAAVGRADRAHRRQRVPAAPPRTGGDRSPNGSRCCCRCATRPTRVTAVPAVVAGPAGRAAAATSWCSTTVRPTAPPTWCARSPATGYACSPATPCRPAGWASRTPATSSPPPYRTRACWSSSTPTWCSRRTRSPPAVHLLRAAGVHAAVAVPADRRRPGGSCSRCCSGRG